MGSAFLIFESLFDLASSRFPPPPAPDCSFCQNRDDPSFIDHDHKPSFKSFVLYSIVTTIISCFGILGNAVSLAVLRRKELVGSVYTYLAVLAATDLALSIIYFIGGILRGTFYNTDVSNYDALIGLPLGGTVNSLGVMATVFVTIDRIIYLWNPAQFTRPKFCSQQIAKLLMSIGLIICTVINLPYWFIFQREPDGHLTTTEFFESRFFSFYNWFLLILLTIIPGIILIFGNGFLIMSLQKARRIAMKCKAKRRRKDHTNLTITLILIIIIFIVTEIPSNLVSKTRSVTLIFFGPHVTPDSEILGIIRAVCTILGAVNVTINFLFYYIFCPAFCRALKKTFRMSQKRKNVQVNVIVLKNDLEIDDVKAKVLEITRKSISCSFKRNGNINKNFVSGTKQTESEYVEIIDNIKQDFTSSCADSESYDPEMSTASIKDSYCVQDTNVKDKF